MELGVYLMTYNKSGNDRKNRVRTSNFSFALFEIFVDTLSNIAGLDPTWHLVVI